MELAAKLHEDWTVWNEGDYRAVLVYRPDVFDSQAFPAPCLPTIYVTKGKRGRRPGEHRPRPDADWFVTLSLEPEVTGERRRYEDQDAAVEGARSLAAAFATGEVDYRALYQVPRDAYLAKLDELTGR